MAGTKQGGKLAAITNKIKYGEDFYAKIGALGGRNGGTGGFYHAKYVLGNDEHARTAGSKGGKISRRKPKETV